MSIKSSFYWNNFCEDSFIRTFVGENTTSVPDNTTKTTFVRDNAAQTTSVGDTTSEIKKFKKKLNLKYLFVET